MIYLSTCLLYRRKTNGGLFSYDNPSLVGKWVFMTLLVPPTATCRRHGYAGPKMAPPRDRIDRCFGSMATSVYDKWSRSIGFAPRVSSEAVVYGIAGEIVFRSQHEDARPALHSRVLATDEQKSAKYHLDGKRQVACTGDSLGDIRWWRWRWWWWKRSLDTSRSSPADSSNIIVLIVSTAITSHSFSKF